MYIRCRRVPLAEVYCSVSENFPLVWTNENRELSVELIPACGAAPWFVMKEVPHEITASTPDTT